MFEEARGPSMASSGEAWEVSFVPGMPVTKHTDQNAGAKPNIQRYIRDLQNVGRPS